MSYGGSMDEAAEGFLPESDVVNFMKRMSELNLPVSPEEIQVMIERTLKCQSLDSLGGYFSKLDYTYLDEYLFYCVLYRVDFYFSEYF